MSAAMIVQIILDLDNRWHRFLDLPEKFQTHGADVFRHAMQNETRRRDNAVAALFLNAGEAGQKFVGDIFAQTGFAKRGTGNFQQFFIEQFLAALVKSAHPKRGKFRIVDFAEVVVEALDLNPLGIRRHHPP